MVIELLSIGNKMLEPMLFRVSPRAGSDGSYSQVGEEFIYMLNGTLEIWLGDLERHLLRPADSFWFKSNVSHRWFNPTDEDASLLGSTRH